MNPWLLTQKTSVVLHSNNFIPMIVIEEQIRWTFSLLLRHMINDIDRWWCYWKMLKQDRRNDGIWAMHLLWGLTCETFLHRVFSKVFYRVFSIVFLSYSNQLLVFLKDDEAGRNDGIWAMHLFDPLQLCAAFSQLTQLPLLCLFCYKPISKSICPLFNFWNYLWAIEFPGIWTILI